MPVRAWRLSRSDDGARHGVPRRARRRRRVIGAHRRWPAPVHCAGRALAGRVRMESASSTRPPGACDGARCRHRTVAMRGLAHWVAWAHRLHGDVYCWRSCATSALQARQAAASGSSMARSEAVRVPLPGHHCAARQLACDPVRVRDARSGPSRHRRGRRRPRPRAWSTASRRACGLRIADDGRGLALDVEDQARSCGGWPRALDADAFIERHGGRAPGVRRTVVPAAPDACIQALESFFAMTFRSVAARAEREAVNGIPASSRVEKCAATPTSTVRTSTSRSGCLAARCLRRRERLVQAGLRSTLQFLCVTRSAPPRARRAMAALAVPMVHRARVSRDKRTRRSRTALTALDEASASVSRRFRVAARGRRATARLVPSTRAWRGRTLDRRCGAASASDGPAGSAAHGRRGTPSWSRTRRASRRGGARLRADVPATR